MEKMQAVEMFSVKPIEKWRDVFRQADRVDDGNSVGNRYLFGQTGGEVDGNGIGNRIFSGQGKVSGIRL